MYSLGKTFEKQIKAIGDQAEKQIKALEEHGKQLVKSNTFAEKEEKSIPLDKQTVIFYNLNMERTEEIVKLHNTINFQNLIYHFKGPTKKIDLNDFIDAEILFDDIMPKKIRFEDVEKSQLEFESKLSSVRIRGNKSNNQLSKIENIKKN